MSRIEESVEVDVPVRVAYDQWTQFEEFPRFMEGVERVVQKDDQTLEWTAEIAGQRRSWEAEISEQLPDRRIAWRSTTGARNDGVVSFQAIDPERTRITLALDVDPEGPVESTGDALGFVQRRDRGDLERFKEFIEARGRETGRVARHNRRRRAALLTGHAPPRCAEAPPWCAEASERSRCNVGATTCGPASMEPGSVRPHLLAGSSAHRV